MTRDKKIIRFAKRLVACSKTDGVVTSENVNEVLDGLRQKKFRHHAGILNLYLKYIRREIARQTAVVATPVELSESVTETIGAGFSKTYGRPIQAVSQNDPSLIAGLRVRIGDDLYDASVAGRLKRLAENVH
ncbi:MAG: FoF1 ATP synthase subunit delta [Opitutales bacterium]